MTASPSPAPTTESATTAGMRRNQGTAGGANRHRRFPLKIGISAETPTKRGCISGYLLYFRRDGCVLSPTLDSLGSTRQEASSWVA